MDYRLECTLTYGVLVGLIGVGVRRQHTRKIKLNFPGLDNSTIVEQAEQLIRGYILGRRYLTSPFNNCVSARFEKIIGTDERVIEFEEGLEVIVTKEELSMKQIK